MQVGLVLWDWIGFNPHAYLKRPLLKSLKHPNQQPLMPKGSPHTLSSFLFLFSWAFYVPIPWDASPKEFHDQGVGHSIICWLPKFCSNTKQGETLKKRRRRREEEKKRRGEEEKGKGLFTLFIPRTTVRSGEGELLFLLFILHSHFRRWDFLIWDFRPI